MFNFPYSMRPMNNDIDVLQFTEDVKWYEMANVYVEHNDDNSRIVDETKLWWRSTM